jgi:hypothetical protein
MKKKIMILAVGIAVVAIGQIAAFAQAGQCCCLVNGVNTCASLPNPPSSPPPGGGQWCPSCNTSTCSNWNGGPVASWVPCG